jgi:hypothetical protein
VLICCRFLGCLRNGTGFVNCLVQMMQPVHITSYSCIRMDCWRGMIWQIAFSATWLWGFSLKLYFNLILWDAHLTRNSHGRSFLLHIVYLRRCNHLNKCRICPSLQLISMENWSFRSWRWSCVLKILYGLFFFGI